MLDFASLNQARQGLQQSGEQRHQQAAALYEQGRLHIREALVQPLDRDRLRQAAGCFGKGMQLHSRNPANFIGMAFLLLLTGQAPQAIPYIRTALELEPESQLARELLEQAQRPPRRPGRKHDVQPLSQPVSQSVPAFDKIDYDALYDATQTEIQILIRQISAQELLTQKPTPDPAKLVQLQDLRADLKLRHADFLELAETIETELDVNLLRQQLGALEAVLRRLEGQIRLFRRFIAILQDIAKHISLTNTVIQAAQNARDPADLPGFEKTLQDLLDHCDQIADQLDELEARHIDIALLYRPYKAYLERIEEYQDALEESTERLQPATS